MEIRQLQEHSSDLFKFEKLDLLVSEIRMKIRGKDKDSLLLVWNDGSKIAEWEIFEDDKNGFVVSEMNYLGNARSRPTRLKLHRIKIRIKTADQFILTGETTGINENGLGANVKKIRTDSKTNSLPIAFKNSIVTVYFDFDEVKLGPTEGEVLYISNSEANYSNYFIAIRFLNMPDSDKMKLRCYIENIEGKHVDECF